VADSSIHLYNVINSELVASLDIEKVYSTLMTKKGTKEPSSKFDILSAGLDKRSGAKVSSICMNPKNRLQV
jgi:hypothetical protein